MCKSDSARVVITAIGALTPLGGNAEQTTAAVQAGISAFSEHPLLYCTPKDPEWGDGLPMFVAAVPTIGSSEIGIERFVQLAIPAINEVMSKAKLTRHSLGRTGFFIALPQVNEANASLNLESLFLPMLFKRTGLKMKFAQVLNEGRVGVLSQITKAIALLESDDLDQCIIGGVDTHLLNEHLLLLDECWRLKSERNVDGFIPGEAAVMLMLETEAHARARGATPLAVINAIGTGVEPEAFASLKESTGTGLAAAINGALYEKPADFQIKNIYCDFNGESYYAFELGLILSRLGVRLVPSQAINHPAECYGDVGSASGGLLIACAIGRFLKIPMKSQEALIWTANDSGKRVALLLTSAEND